MDRSADIVGETRQSPGRVEEANRKLDSAVKETDTKLDETRTELTSTTQKANEACTKVACGEICAKVLIASQIEISSDNFAV